MLYVDQLVTPIGKLKIVATNKGIKEVIYTTEIVELNPNDYTTMAKKQLEAYFNHQLEIFDLPLDLDCSDFSSQVYEQMRKIPYSQVVSYKDLAKKINKPNASRAVGKACHHNPCLIIIPCHRVVASDYTLKGFAIGLDIKRYLLEFEGMSCLEDRVVV